MAASVQAKKRIIVCCDGTWMDSDGQYQVPSNVTRIARAIKPVGVDENGDAINQIIFYQNGVGTGSKSAYVKYVGGATGDGLGLHIREAYSFICQNYQPDDEIFLIGFSRGAFTARSISSLIRALGLLTSKGQESFDSIFEDWQNQSKRGYKTKYPDYPWPGHKPPVDAPEYQRKLLELELTRPSIPIKAVAVWDTVGGLGIPMIGLLPQPPSTDFSFVDTKVEPNIEHAFQALALDEHRRAYAPTIWEKPDGQAWPRTLKQTWFPGVHSDIGGSYPDTDLANLTLCWMVSQLDPLIDIEHNYVWKQVRLGIEKHEAYVAQIRKQNPGTQLPATRPWGLGKIHDSMTVFFRLGGSQIRTPGEYTEHERADQHGTLYFMADKLTARLLRKPDPKPRLTNTNETFHSSVRIRMGKKGKGYDDKGFYDSQALEGWVMSGDMADPDTPHQQQLPGQAGAMKNVVWHKRVTYANGRLASSSSTTNGTAKHAATTNGNTAKKDGTTPKHSLDDDEEDNMMQTLAIPEDEMGAFERKILQLWPEINEEFDAITPGGHVSSITKSPTTARENKRSLTYPPRGLKGLGDVGNGQGAAAAGGADNPAVTVDGVDGVEGPAPAPAAPSAAPGTDVPMLRADGVPPRRRSLDARSKDDNDAERKRDSVASANAADAAAEDKRMEAEGGQPERAETY